MEQHETRRLAFASDYMEGAHPAVLRRLCETNLISTPGYGTDEFTGAAKEKIRAACEAPAADVHFLVGGTQTNAVVIGALLRPYQGVIAAETGHISLHEAGAIEAGGHKVIALPHQDGKLSADAVRQFCRAFYADENRDHMVQPGLVYLSQPTEYGTLYAKDELRALSAVCREYGMGLYLDGARLAYALASPANTLTLPEIARLCDAFYIGGTKCGALFGEAAVFPKPDLVPHFFTIVKQNGALLAKGRVAGVQFDALFSDGLYGEIGKTAIAAAERIRAALKEKGYRTLYGSPTNQIFLQLSPRQAERLTAAADLSFWETLPCGDTVYRLATGWATTDEAVDRLIALL